MVPKIETNPVDALLERTQIDLAIAFFSKVSERAMAKVENLKAQKAGLILPDLSVPVYQMGGNPTPESLASATAAGAAAEKPAPKRRGRPPGTKNKAQKAKVMAAGDVDWKGVDVNHIGEPPSDAISVDELLGNAAAETGETGAGATGAAGG